MIAAIALMRPLLFYTCSFPANSAGIGVTPPAVAGCLWKASFRRLLMVRSLVGWQAGRQIAKGGRDAFKFA